MKKFNYNSYLFINKKQKNIPSTLKSNIELSPLFLKKSVKIYNGLNYFTIDEVQKKHLSGKIGTFINTRVSKKQ